MRSNRKAALEKALKICRGIHKQQGCFECDLGKSHRIEDYHQGLKYDLGLILVALGVPEGEHRTFVLEISGKFAVCRIPYGARCGSIRNLYGDDNEATWQAFIDEVATIVSD